MDNKESVGIAIEKIDERLAFLQSFSNGLVPELGEDSVDPLTREALQKQKEEAAIRINELTKLKKEMLEN